MAPKYFVAALFTLALYSAVSITECSPLVIGVPSGQGQAELRPKESTLQTFEFFKNATDWYTARRTCHDRGMRLLQLKTRSKWEDVQVYLLQNYIVEHLWIGLNDLRSEGVWSWEDGSLLVSGNWESSASNDNTRNCAGLMPNGNWFASPCLPDAVGTPQPTTTDFTTTDTTTGTWYICTSTDCSNPRSTPEYRSTSTTPNNWYPESTPAFWPPGTTIPPGEYEKPEPVNGCPTGPPGSIETTTLDSGIPVGPIRPPGGGRRSLGHIGSVGTIGLSGPLASIGNLATSGTPSRPLRFICESL